MRECDRCKRPIHHNYFPKLVLTGRKTILFSHNVYNYLESQFILCRRCANEFEKFMKGADNERKAD